MSRVKSILIFLFSIVLLTPLVYSKEELSLIPMPREVEFQGGSVYLSNHWQIVLEKEDIPDSQAGDLLAKEAKDCYHWDWKISYHKPKTEYIEIRGYALKGDEPKLFQEQG